MGNHLKEAGIDTSMGSKGSPLDNAVAESFFATFKKDLINRRSWPQKAETRSAIFEWIEVFYNRQRIHTTLGNYAPEEFETLNLKVVGSNPTRPIAFQSGSRLPAGAALALWGNGWGNTPARCADFYGGDQDPEGRS